MILDRRLHRPHSRRRRAVTMIELVIAIMLMAVVVLAFMSATTFGMTSMRATIDRQMTLDAMQLWEARILGANRANLGEPNLVAANPEWALTQVATWNPDPTFPLQAPTITVTPRYKGWGYADASSGTTTLVRGPKVGTLNSTSYAGYPNLPAWWLPWTVNEFAGNLVVITAGPGQRQMARIISNTATTLTVSTDIRTTDTPGYNPARPWDTTIGANSQFFISNAKTVDLTVSWATSRAAMGATDAAATQTITRRILADR